MIRRRGWLAVLFVLASLRPLSTLGAPVGDYGVPGHLTVEGARTFPAGEIITELVSNLDVAHAASREAPLEKFKTALVEKTREGYLHAGFADVQVTIREEQDRLILTVDEGPRFLAGAVQVEGTSIIDGSELKGAWAAGKPARFDSMSQPQLNARLATTFKERWASRSSCNDFWRKGGRSLAGTHCRLSLKRRRNPKGSNGVSW